MLIFPHENPHLKMFIIFLVMGGRRLKRNGLMVLPHISMGKDDLRCDQYIIRDVTSHLLSTNQLSQESIIFLSGFDT